MSTPLTDRRPGMRRLGVALHGQRVAVERRRAPTRFRVGIGPEASAGPITLGVMRAMVAAADALRAYAKDLGIEALPTEELAHPGTELADLLRRYQAASRQFIKDWLHDLRRTSWLVDAASGRALRPRTGLVRVDPAFAGDLQLTLAEDQQLHGLRKRSTRDGIGVPVAAWQRPSGPEAGIDEVQAMVPRAWTAVVSVEQDPDRRVRQVRVRLEDPALAASVTLAGVKIPLAADFTAPVAQALSLGRRPAAAAYGIRDSARRGTLEGFTPLTPFTPHGEQLVLMEGAGHSPTMMAQIANEVAGDSDLRDRFQVWLYRYDMVAPLFVAASEFREDLQNFCARLAPAAGRESCGRVTIVAQRLGAVLARALLTDSGSAIWDAVFTAPLEKTDVRAADRALLVKLLFWRPSALVDRVLVLGEYGDPDALTAGVGDRAVQLLNRQSQDLRAAVERIYGGQKQHLREPTHDAGADSRGTAEDPMWPEPVRQALANAVFAADRALLSLLAGKLGERDASPGQVAPAAVELASPPAELPGDILGPIALRRLLEQLRLNHRPQ